MNKIRISLWVLLMVLALSVSAASSPIAGLLERIDKGASKKFIIEQAKSSSGNDFFELDQRGDKVVVRGNNYVSIATGSGQTHLIFEKVH